jgi:hypothetical protein
MKNPREKIVEAEEAVVDIEVEEIEVATEVVKEVPIEGAEEVTNKEKETKKIKRVIQNISKTEKLLQRKEVILIKQRNTSTEERDLKEKEKSMITRTKISIRVNASQEITKVNTRENTREENTKVNSKGKERIDQRETINIKMKLSKRKNLSQRLLRYITQKLSWRSLLIGTLFNSDD